MRCIRDAFDGYDGRIDDEGDRRDDRQLVAS
jgi:hypothetical protein